MSDEHDDGGHEIDRVPNGRLFNLLFGLSALTLLACVGVVQMFYLQVEVIEGERAKKGAPTLREHNRAGQEVATGFGRYETKGAAEANRSKGFYVPVSNAKKQVLDNKALLRGTKPGPKFAETTVGKQIKDWGGMPKPPAAPAKPAAPGAKVPAGAKPSGAKAPAGAKPAGTKPAGAKPPARAGAAKPAEGKAPVDKKPAPGAKPAAGAKPPGAGK